MMAEVTAATACAWGTWRSVVHSNTSSAIPHASAECPHNQQASADAARGAANAMSSTDRMGGRSPRL